MQYSSKTSDTDVKDDQPEQKLYEGSDTSPREQTRLAPIHVLPRKVEVQWFIAIYILMFTAGERVSSSGHLIHPA